RGTREYGLLGHQRVAKKLPRRRFVALSTASDAARGGSVSVREEPTSREALAACRAERETITTVASKARTAFTPRSSKPISGCTTRSSACTQAWAEQRSSPACEVTPSASPTNWRPSAQASTTFERQRPLASR